ncbi:MAG: hypothetical protein ACTHOD_00080 [Motilibacteraceae bacterium]
MPTSAPRTDARPAPGTRRLGRPGAWHRAMASPAVPALAATAVVGLAAGALWGHASLASQAAPLPAPAPTVTLVRTVPVPAPTTRASTPARAVARNTSAGVASPRVVPATQAVLRQVPTQPRRPAPAKGGHHDGQGKQQHGTSGGKKADGHHGGKGGEKEDHHRAGGKEHGKAATKDARREHAAAPQRSHRS